jgi:hypothetical protein
MTQTQVAYHPFQGGLDLVSPVLNIKPGFLLDGINYEPDINGGYRRIPGYERFDGQPSPSDRANVVLQLDDASQLAVGDALTGQSSQSTGTIVLIDERLVCLCSVTGVFESEIVSNGQVTATVTSLDYTQDAMTAYSQQERWQAMEDHYRAQIEQPSGTGKVEGVCHYKGVTYAFRKSGDRVLISQSTPAGWDFLEQHEYLRFRSGGGTEPEEGDTITTPDGVAATIQRYIRQGGSRDDLSVYGYLMLDQLTGDINDGDRLELGSHGAGKVQSVGYVTMTIEGIPTVATLPAVGEQIKNQNDPPAMGTVHEAILRQTGDAPDVINGWFLVSDVAETFAEGDSISRVLEDDVTEPDPFGNIKGQPLPAIQSIDHGDTPAEIGNIVEFGINDDDPEGRVYWSHTYSDDEGERLYLVLQDLTEQPTADSNIYVIQIAGYAKGDIVPVELAAGGTFEFSTWNFFARPDQERIYGCNGIDPAFELNPKTGLICPILMDDESQVNNPHAIEAHKNHLFLGLPGGLVRHSVIGEPLNFNGQLGAFEVGTGDEVTALVSHPGDVLAIICRNRIQGLYGQTIDDWQMNLIAENAGGYQRSVQLLQQAYMLDDNGIIELQRVLAYGNFENSAVSRLVQPLINKHKTDVIGSCVLRDHNLICFFFTNGVGITFRPNPGKLPEILIFEYPEAISCVHYAEDEAGAARVFFGTEDGWVYEARKGSNFDGEPIESVIRTSYNHLKSPTYRKSFKRLELMLSGGYDVFLQVGMELDYSAAYTPAPVIRNFTLFGGQGGYWNEDNWNEFYWSGQDVSTGEVSVSGTGKNYSIMIYSKSAWTTPYTLQGVMVHYIPRRLDRG